MGGGLGAMICGAVGGMGTTLMRGAEIMGGTCAKTCPGARRTTGATGGRGITGTADRRVVRTGGGIGWRTQVHYGYTRTRREGHSKQIGDRELTVIGGRGIVVMGGLGLGKLEAEDGMGG